MIAIAVIAGGALLALVGGIGLVVDAFRVSSEWGLTCLFVPFAGWVHGVKYFEHVKAWFFLQLAGFPIVAIGGLLMLTLPDPVEVAPSVRSSAGAAVVEVDAGAADPAAPAAACEGQAAAAFTKCRAECDAAPCQRSCLQSLATASQVCQNGAAFFPDIPVLTSGAVPAWGAVNARLQTQIASLSSDCTTSRVGTALPTLIVYVAVKADGTLADANVIRMGGADADFADCAESVFKGITLPSSSADYAVVATGVYIPVAAAPKP